VKEGIMKAAKFDADRYVGTRWRLGDVDFTIISYDPATDAINAHLTTGARGTMTGEGFMRGLEEGVVEVVDAVPFELVANGEERAMQRVTERGTVYVAVKRHGRTVLVPADDYR
jgi:hypothetical protein